MSKYLVLLAMVALVAFAMPTFADDEMVYPHKGGMYTSFGASYMDVEDTDITMVNGLLGYFVTDPVSLDLGLGYLDGSGIDDSTTWQFGVKYHFLTATELGNFVPYIGAYYTYVDAEGDTGNGWAGALGANFFLKPYFSITPEIRIGQMEIDDVDMDYTTVTLGMTYWFN